VEIGFIDFQGEWEGWKNSFIVFPCFPLTGISTACFVPLCGRPRVSVLSAAFILRRADIVQGGEHALAVVPQQPSKPVQPFHLRERCVNHILLAAFG